MNDRRNEPKNNSPRASASADSATSAYGASGVDVEKGDAFVEWIQKGDRGPHADKIVSGVGGFAALFRADFKNYERPLIVSSTDGVGTKVVLAANHNRLEHVGQDLVAMCVNDLVTSGADPLFFLDYYAVGKLDLDQAKTFLSGVRRACHESGCALIGGETAEMPGVYRPPDFDCAGFSVGVVDEVTMWNPSRAKKGDVVIGVSSSGFHSNGYSLLRRIFDRDLSTWLDQLMTPTALYPALVKHLRQDSALCSQVRSSAHITGGGMENLPRAFGTQLSLRLQRWNWPAAFVEVKSRAGVSEVEMLKTLNCGVGFAFVVDPNGAAGLRAAIGKHGFVSIDLGTLESSDSHEPTVDYSLWDGGRP